MLKDFCPIVNGACRGKVCKLFFDQANDCSWTLSEQDNAYFLQKQQDEEKLGILRVKKELGEVFSRAFLRNLNRDPDFTEEDRILVAKLNQERLQGQKLIDLKHSGR